jgi:hypothetical protein
VRQTQLILGCPFQQHNFQVWMGAFLREQCAVG